MYICKTIRLLSLIRCVGKEKMMKNNSYDNSCKMNLISQYVLLGYWQDSKNR